MTVCVLSFLIGKTTFMSTLSCDRVIDGAFFPQPDFQVPEEEVGKHTSEYMVVPAPELTHFIMIHPQVVLRLLERLLDGPTKPAKPDKSLEPIGYPAAQAPSRASATTFLFSRLQNR